MRSGADPARPASDPPASGSAGREDEYETRLIRRWRFRAAHSYGRPDWSEERNRRRFGALARPHEHLWTVEARIRGPIGESGFIVDLRRVDAAWEELTAGWDGSDIGSLLPEGVAPSTEDLARWLYRRLAPSLTGAARLEQVAVWEDEGVGAEHPAALAQHPQRPGCQ